MQSEMGMQTLNFRIEQLRQSLDWSHQVSREACRVLDQYCNQLSDLERNVQPVVSKTQSLIQTRENIKQARAQAEEVLEHLDASRKVKALCLSPTSSDISPRIMRLAGGSQDLTRASH